jgi:hypothetical protein
LNAATRIQRSFTFVQTGVARIRQHGSAQLQGTSRLQNTFKTTLDAVSRIRNTFASTVAGRARVQQSETGNIAGCSRIRIHSTAQQNAVSRVRVTGSRLQFGVGRIQGTFTQQAAGIARLQLTFSQNQSATSTIAHRLSVTLIGIVRVQVRPHASVSGCSRIYRVRPPKRMLTVSAQQRVLTVPKPLINTGVAKVERLFKYPTDELDIPVNWTNWLATSADNDKIATVEWAITPDGLTIANQTQTNTVATLWVMGGQAGVVYQTICRITSQNGRQRTNAIGSTEGM